MHLTKDAKQDWESIWETLSSHGIGSFRALVSSPGAQSGSINIDLLKMGPVYTRLLDEEGNVLQNVAACQPGARVHPCRAGAATQS